MKHGMPPVFPFSSLPVDCFPISLHLFIGDPKLDLLQPFAPPFFLLAPSFTSNSLAERNLVDPARLAFVC